MTGFAALVPGRQEMCSGAEDQRDLELESGPRRSCLPFPTGTGQLGALENEEEEGKNSVTSG